MSTSTNTISTATMEQEFIEILQSVPKEILKIQGIDVLDSVVLADRYFESDVVADASIDPNANVGGKAPVNFQSEIFKPQLKLRSYYELWKRLRNEYGCDDAKAVMVAVLDGSLYFHDITKIDIPYCFAFDVSNIMFYGRPYGWLPGKAPTRSSSFIGQVIETTMDYSQQLAGAIGIPNLLVDLAYFTRKERAELISNVSHITGMMNQSLAIAAYAGGLGYSGKNFMGEDESDPDKECLADNILYMLQSGFTLEETINKVYDKYVENLLQQFVHVMHNTFRVGGDSPFTNISIFDREIIKDMFDGALYPDYSKAVDNLDEIVRVQNIFIEFFVKGSPVTNKNYRFPVATVNLKTWSAKDATQGKCTAEEVGKVSDSEYFDYIMDMNLPRGTFNIHIGEKVATCCRLTSDLAELKENVKMDSFGNGGISIGSHRVVALNLHRLALKYRDMKDSDPIGNAHLDFITVLHQHMHYAEMALVVHKKLLKERVDSGFLQFFNIGWCDLNMFFSTFGFTGLWDMYKVMTKLNAHDDLDYYAAICSEVLNGMEQYAKIAGKRNDGFAFNVEEIPGENASPKLAMMDNYYYKDKEGYEPVDLLSNQMIPLYENVDFFKRLEVTGKLMKIVSGGGILHLNLSEAISPELYRKLNRMIIEEYGVQHYAINVGTTTCVNDHTVVGIHQQCPICDGDIKTHTIRVVGFNTDTTTWIKQRREGEWDKGKGRQFYSSTNIMNQASDSNE